MIYCFIEISVRFSALPASTSLCHPKLLTPPPPHNFSHKTLLLSLYHMMCVLFSWVECRVTRNLYTIAPLFKTVMQEMHVKDVHA